MDPDSNYDSNVTIEDCDGLESNQLSENECFCKDESENDIEYSICKATLFKDTLRWQNTKTICKFMILVISN